MRQERPVRHDVAPVNAERNENIVKRKSNKTATCGITECKQAQSHSHIEIGNGLMIYGLLYKLNKDNEFYVQMPQHIGRDGDYHSTVAPLS